MAECKCKIPNKKLQPSPCLKSYVPGENVVFREITKRVTEINVINGGGAQKWIVSVDEPTNISVNDFWMQVIN